MIDSSMFYAKIPAGTYAKGDVVQLELKDGPANVRSGRGTAILKRIMGFAMSGASGYESYWRIHVKNSDWIDDAIVTGGNLIATTALDQHSGSVRIGNDTNLTPNSSWTVWAECISATTTTSASSIVALIDIDYPQVSSIVNPDTLVGVPASITHDVTSVPYYAPGDMDVALFTTENVDFLKAGWQYALQEIGIFSNSHGGGMLGFIKISNAAGMGGLSRIVPMGALPDGIKQTIQYASLLVKGPMDISYMMFRPSGSTSTTDVETIFDFVKRKV